MSTLMLFTEQDLISAFPRETRILYKKYSQAIRLRETYGYGPRRLARIIHLPQGMVGHWIYNGCKPLIPQRIAILKDRNWIPLRGSSELAQCLARLTGYVLGDDTLKRRYVIFYGDRETLSNILKDIEGYLRLTGHIKPRKNTHELVISDVTLATLLHVFGIPYGDRALQPFNIPKFVANGDAAIIRSFLQGLSDAELRGLSLRTEHGYSVASLYLRMHKVQEHVANLENFLTNVCELFQKINVDCSKISKPHYVYARKAGKKTYSVTLHLRSDLLNIHKFCNNADFYYHKKKQKQMIKIFTRVEDKLKSEARKVAACEVAKELRSKHGWGRTRIARELHKMGYTIPASTVDGWIRNKR